ncbi:hypothetical protein CTEN210_07819 [Chaetoceros tenuissimus]|uniref:Trimethylguanosine synthase n=1 Tax=Chaetoceros tenuissimus TaxID=426638 RepID=A0AAD3CSX4_9STRA|nr:hypothetical protein CTEN210_07819 [Chaetoceros tenuissimus]
MTVPEFKNEIDETLSNVLIGEITKDGGKVLVRDLKDYNLRIKSLLRKASTNKLLSFLETYPEVFSVDRSNEPHTVYLEILLRPTNASDKLQMKMKQLLLERIIYILKKEESKASRRNNGNTTKGVNVRWLLQQCKKDSHLYLREIGYYAKVYESPSSVNIVGSSEWVDIVLDAFQSIAEEVCDIQHGRATIKNSIGQASIDSKLITESIVKAVNDDGGTHISLALLLCRYPHLRSIIGSVDLIEFKKQHCEMLDGIEIFRQDNDIILETTIMRKGRMLCDETGLFSVANSKCGKKFATIMANACALHLKQNVRDTVAIDLTASVGGVTLGLSRKKFVKVAAIEIDENRAEMCRQNMKAYDCSNVQVYCQDAIECLPIIAQEYRGFPCVVICDPPWGGKYYKKQADRVLKMGPWTMLDVVSKVSQHFAPTLLGFRMPTDFDNDIFCEKLKSAGLIFEVVKKQIIGPQLFLVFHLRDKP